MRVVGGDDCDAAQVKEGLVDRITVTEERLERLAREEGHWARSGFVGARVLFERTGRIEALVARIASYDEETGARLAYEHYDGYLNGFVRSLRAWQQGNEFGARLQAAESLTCLVKALFALERRVAPYHDRLVGPALDALAGQGWRPGELERTLLELARSAAPAAQQALEARVEALMESRGVRAHAEWGEQLERLKAARF